VHGGFLIFRCVDGWVRGRAQWNVAISDLGENICVAFVCIFGALAKSVAATAAARGCSRLTHGCGPCGPCHGLPSAAATAASKSGVNLFSRAIGSVGAG